MPILLAACADLDESMDGLPAAAINRADGKRQLNEYTEPNFLLDNIRLENHEPPMRHAVGASMGQASVFLATPFAIDRLILEPSAFWVANLPQARSSALPNMTLSSLGSDEDDYVFPGPEQLAQNLPRS
jgi:hypothetical protein